MSVGVSGDTAQFSVASIRAWWKHLGKKRYPNALPARHLQVEQGRAPPVQLHLDQLARQATVVSRQVVIDLIASTTTTTGLKVYARLDENNYPTKLKVTDQQLAAVQLEGDHFHPEWNYTINPSLEKK